MTDWWLPVAGVVVFLLVIGLWLGCRRPRNVYERAWLLSENELAFYRVLERVVDHRQYVIFCKTRLEDIVRVKNGVKNYHALRNRIKSSHIDFLICRRRDLTVWRAVELDDRSHETPNAMRSDALKDRVCAQAGIVLVRAQSKTVYRDEDIRTLLTG